MKSYTHNYRTIFSLLIIFISTSVVAQQNIYKWRIGGNIGATSYYGDVSYKFFKQSHINLGYGASAEYSFTKSGALRFSYNAGEFSASDRQFKNNPNFDRALNFKNHYQSIDATLVFYTDNGKIFGKNAFLSPYFFVGVGAMKFDVCGDLFDKNGERYHYWSNGLITNLDEAHYTGVEDYEILEINGVYETNLRNLNTEKTNGYKNQAIYIPFGLGLKFRLSNRINFNLETKFNYAFTDYLDDVSNNPINSNLSDPLALYAANPNNNIIGNRSNQKWNLNDVFIYTSASLYFNFGKRKNTFKAPALHANNEVIKSGINENERLKARLENQIQSDSINEFVLTQKPTIRSSNLIERSQSNLDSNSAQNIIDSLLLENEKLSEKNTSLTNKIVSQQLAENKEEIKSTSSNTIDTIYLNKGIIATPTTTRVKLDTVKVEKSNLIAPEPLHQESSIIKKGEVDSLKTPPKLSTDSILILKKDTTIQTLNGRTKTSVNDLINEEIDSIPFVKKVTVESDITQTEKLNDAKSDTVLLENKA